MASHERTKRSWIAVNRAPVLTLWAAVVAERLGFNRSEALTLGCAVAGLNAYAKGKSIGIFKPGKSKVARARTGLKTGAVIKVDLLGRAVPAKRYKDGLRAISKGRPIAPETVEAHLQAKFGDALAETRRVMARLASAYPPSLLSENACALYTEFRPRVPEGKQGWGTKGRLSLSMLTEMAARQE